MEEGELRWRTSVLVRILNEQAVGTGGIYWCPFNRLVATPNMDMLAHIMQN